MTTKPILTEDDFKRYQSMKEECVSEMDERGTDDMEPLIELWRDGEPIMSIFCPQIDRDMALNAIHFATPRIAADRVVTIMDAHVTKNMNNPATGEPWGPGEMQQACDNEDACSIGLLTDCLAVTDIHKDGTKRMNALTYHVDKDKKRVHWSAGDEYSTSTDTDEVRGLVPDTITDSLQIDTETIHAALPPEHTGVLDESQQRALKDASTLIQLNQSGYMVAYAISDQELFENVMGIVEAFNRISGNAIDYMASEPGL